MPKFIELYDQRLKRKWYVNVEHILSFYEDKWPGTASLTCVEVRGQQGYGNHNIYINQTCDQLLGLINTTN